MKSNSPPPPASTSSDSDLVDWYLHSVRLSSAPPPGAPKDVRGVSLIHSLNEFFLKLAAAIPSAEEVKNPFDYWSFVESIFSPSLRSSMIPETGMLTTPPSVVEAREILAKSFPHYSWTWAVDDCIKTDLLTAKELEAIRAQLPVGGAAEDQQGFSQLTMELEKSLAIFDEATKQGALSLLKLHKWLKLGEKGSDYTKLRNASLTALLSFSENLILQLQKEQFLDSIEELHEYRPNRVAVVVDDGERVRCFTTSISDAAKLLKERDTCLEGPQAESVQYKYPFAVRAGDQCPRLPQLGPFCHICRQAKSNLARCNNKLSVFYGEVKEFKSVCHRKFCIDCLVAYNWPKPEPGKDFKCPICAKLCTCDRCVRNVFLKCIRSFISGLKCESVNVVSEVPHLTHEAEYVPSVRDFLAIVGDMSAFSVIPATPSLESPSGDIPMAPLSITGRAKRHSAGRVDDVATRRSLSRATSELLDKGNIVKSEHHSSDDEMQDDTSVMADESSTPPSDRKRRKAASVAESLLRSQMK